MIENLVTFGSPLSTARAAVVLVHGRGATAESMLPLAEALPEDGLAFLAPQAPGNQWYPYPFMAPIENNEPHLSNALRTLSQIVVELESAGLPPERVMLLGFSQGACLATEFAARNARRYGGIAGLSGGLIGPPGTSRGYPGSLDGTPVFLGCSDVDPHIPKERVLETEQALRRMGAEVTTRLYPGFGHTINEDELNFLQEMVKDLVQAGAAG
jgi:predicted esterase